MINKGIEPLVYIIMPCYNGGKYLLEQLMSIYFQNYTNWYLIFVNDGSTDNSENIIRDWISHYHLYNKVKVISKENGGVTSAVQRGLEEIKTICDIHNNDSLISYCDSDDIWTREKLSIQVEYMVNHPECDLSFHDLSLINENGILSLDSRMKIRYNDTSFLYIATVGNIIVSTAIMYKSEYIDSLLPMPTGPQIYQDMRTSLVFTLSEYNIGYIDITLAYYRQGHSSLIGIAKKIDQKNRIKNELKIYESLQKKFPQKDFSDIINYNLDRYVNRYKYGLVSIRQYILILIKYPKIFYLLLKVFFWKLFKHGKFLK